MSIRTKVLGFVDVMMRVPPVLIIDEILKISMGLPSKFNPIMPMSKNVTYEGGSDGANSSTNTISEPLEALLSSAKNSTPEVAETMLDQAIDNATATAQTYGIISTTFGMLMDDLAQESSLSELLQITSVKIIICFIGLLCALSVFLLWTRHLVMVYMFALSLGLTFLSYWSNVSAITLITESPSIMEDILSINTTRLLDTGGPTMSLIPHLMAQWFMGMLFAYIHLGPRYTTLQKFMPLIFISPILLAMLPLPLKLVNFLPVLSTAVPLVLSKVTLMRSAMEVAKTVYNGYHYALSFISNFGLSALIENEWQRLNVPNVLRVFWVIRITQEFSTIALNDGITTDNLFSVSQKVLVDGCETLTAVLGMTAVISLICHYIGKGFQWYLLTMDNDEEKSLGTVSAVLFYILALQTGLTSLDPDKRFERLCRNMCLLATALLHFLHNIVSPILMSLSAARNPSRKRHIRALTVCAFLVFAPVGLLITLWARHPPSTWLLAVTAFSVEVIVKVLVSLATYTLFLLDARRQNFWEKLDDYLYYVRVFGNSVEFCFGILLFFNGAWILVFESGGAIRAIMMCIHAYFNIWCEARAGWVVFMKRRSAVHKISALPEATPAQLRAFDDVCAICYQEMYSAKITRCRHFFHGVCLRKWLYVQDRCPLCHEIMMYTDKPEEPNATAADAAVANALLRQRENENENGAGVGGGAGGVGGGGGGAGVGARNAGRTLQAHAEQLGAALGAASTSSFTAHAGTSASTTTAAGPQTPSAASASAATTAAAAAATATTTATATSAAAAAVATAAASNSSHTFRMAAAEANAHD